MNSALDGRVDWDLLSHLCIFSLTCLSTENGGFDCPLANWPLVRRVQMPILVGYLQLQWGYMGRCLPISPILLGAFEVSVDVASPSRFVHKSTNSIFPAQCCDFLSQAPYHYPFPFHSCQVWKYVSKFHHKNLTWKQELQVWQKKFNKGSVHCLRRANSF